MRIMWVLIIVTSYLLTSSCLGIIFIDLPTNEELQRRTTEEDLEKRTTEKDLERTTDEDLQGRTTVELQESEESHDIIQRRLMRASYPRIRNDPKPSKQLYTFRHSEHPYAEDEKDLDIKNKIAAFVQQTVDNTKRKMKSLQSVKDDHKDRAPYKIGFILSMIKKARDVLNELFNVAVKHRDEWKSLEQLKIFELIVHTNVDTTNLVRQMVEIHIQHLNSAKNNGGKSRMVLI